MSVDIATIKEHVGDTPVLLTVRREDGTEEKLEGKIEVASEAGVGFKPKGRREMDLLEVEDIVGIEEAPVTEAKLKQVGLKPIELGRVKKHLIDRHGAPLSQVNALTAEQAEELHNKIDHTDLGHHHNKKDKPKEEQAEAAPEAAESVPEPTGDAPY